MLETRLDELHQPVPPQCDGLAKDDRAGVTQSSADDATGADTNIRVVIFQQAEEGLVQAC